MAGGGSFYGDQQSAHATADGQLVTNRARVTSIQAKGIATSEIKLYDGTGTGGTLKLDYVFGTEGLNVWIPGSGVVFNDGVYLDLTNTTGVTITYT
jgi:hypothetical protein